MSVVNPIINKVTLNGLSKAATSAKAPANTDAIFREAKKQQPTKKQGSVYTRTLDNLTRQSKVNLKGSKINQQQEQELVYQGTKGTPLNMQNMINPLDILQQNAMMQNQNMMMQGMMSAMPQMYGGGTSMMPTGGSGGTVTLAQAEALLGVRTAKNPFYTGSGGSLSASEKRQMASFLQRYIAEGAARGVDVVAMIKKLPGGTLKVGLASWSGNGIGVGGPGAGSLFRRDWWNNNISNGKAMGLFFQEISHGLGLMQDTARGDNARGWMDGARSANDPVAYERNFDMLFADFKTQNRRTITMGAVGGGMGAPSGYTPGAQAAGDPYTDLFNGIMQGFQMGANGQPIPGAAGQPQAPAAPPLPQITPPSPIPTLQPSPNQMQPMQGLHNPNVAQPGGGGPTLGLDTNPYGGQSFDDAGGLDADVANSTHGFAAQLDTIPTQSVPMLQGLAGALLSA